MIRSVFKYGLFLLLLAPTLLFGQKDKDDEERTNVIEQRLDLLDNQDADIDYTTLFETLRDFYESPINLNNTDAEELGELGLLNDLQINALLDHIAKNRKLLNIYELQTIAHFDLETIKSILPFVKVSGDIDQSQFSLKQALKEGKHELFLRYIRILEETKGFSPISDEDLAESPNSRFLGDPNKLYTRYRFKYGQHISWGFTAEKDQGEEFFTGSQPDGFDFYSAHLYIAKYGWIKQAIVGDFHAQFGQGLTMWTGQAFGKSIDLLSIKRNARGLRPYTAVDENLFLHGAGTTVDLGKLDLTLLSSYKKVDANLSVDTINNIDNIFSSLQGTGFHSTPAELIDKDAINQTVFGANLEYRTRSFNAGVTAARTAFEGDFNRNLGIYNQFEFSDNENLSLGFHHNFTYKNTNIFGEVARSENGAFGTVQGALIALDPGLTFTALYRNYARDFFTLNNNGIAENSRAINESGLLLGLEARFGLKWSLKGYLDQFKFPWLRSTVDAPSNGYEGIAQLTWKPKRGTELYFRYRNRSKSTNSDLDTPIDLIVATNQVNYRFNLSSKVNDNVRLKSRAEWTNYEQDGEKSNGFLVYQDVIYKALSSPLSFSFRYAFFDTDNYDSRIYAYENDVLYYFSIPSYSSQGVRYYLTTKYRVSRNMDLWVRYSQWRYLDRDTAGSGLNEINGNTRSEVKVQVRLKF